MPCVLGSFWKVKDGHLTILNQLLLFPLFWSELLTVNINSVSVCAMYSIFTKYILKKCEKRSGMEPGNEMFKASIVGTGKSIDFYKFV